MYTGNGGVGDLLLHVNDVGPLVTRPSRLGGLLDLGLQFPAARGATGGDLREGGERAREARSLSKGDLDLRLRIIN